MARLNPFDKRRQRVRTSLRARAGDRPRLSVHRSGRHIYAQIIVDGEGRTVAAAAPTAAALAARAAMLFGGGSRFDGSRGRFDSRLGRGLGGRVGFVSHHQNSNPPSRAASASALTRP